MKVILKLEGPIHNTIDLLVAYDKALRAYLGAPPPKSVEEVYGPQIDETPENECGIPCDPSNPCDECAEYWQRMKAEGYWDGNAHAWTPKGWREITK